MSVKLLGSEDEDEVPESFAAYLDAMGLRVIFSTPAYMEIPYINCEQEEDLFNTCAGVTSVGLKDLIEDYASDCIRDDSGDGVLVLADFFDKTAKQLREFYLTLDQDEIAKSKMPFDLVFTNEN
ncbi:hypothetical protein [Enterobacter asburiae]|uniref:hypothetical protein n=1 Tax=Enterobacter asburiae TaxID=61645 RepID=UPI00192C6040|nr:hypothetical protein [Enterobacter asburiae]MBL5911274.1 hypothetical protein [Enterobacter asburiae]